MSGINITVDARSFFRCQFAEYTSPLKCPLSVPNCETGWNAGSRERSHHHHPPSTSAKLKFRFLRFFQSHDAKSRLTRWRFAFLLQVPATVAYRRHRCEPQRYVSRDSRTWVQAGDICVSRPNRFQARGYVRRMYRKSFLVESRQEVRASEGQEVSKFGFASKERDTVVSPRLLITTKGRERKYVVAVFYAVFAKLFSVRRGRL